jgi:hypothetical protein
VPHADERQVAETVSAMARFGRYYRVGLEPSPVCRHWRFDELVRDRRLQCRPTFGGDSIEDVLAWAEVQRPSNAIAVQFLAGDLVVLGIDHGIGDAHVMLEIMAAVSTASEQAGFRPPAPVANTNHPFFWAFLQAMKSPAEMSRGVRKTFAARTSQDRSAISESVTLKPAREKQRNRSDSVNFAFVRSEPHLVTRLKEQRRASGVEASLAACIMSSVCDALRSRDVSVGNDIEVLTDLRKYLPAKRSTFANFVSVVTVPYPAGGTPVQLGAALAAEVDSFSPLLKAAGSLVLAQVRRSGMGKTPIQERTHSHTDECETLGPVVVSFSDLTKLPVDSRIRWAGSRQPELAVLLPSPSASRISVSLIALGDEIQATATFCARRVDSPTVRAALQQALQLDFICGPK